MPKKISIDFIRQQLQKEGYKLLSTEYIDAHKYLKFECNNGHIHKIRWNNWKNGDRCKYCSIYSSVSYEDIQNHLIDNKCQLLTTESEYINTIKTKIKYKCSQGHINETYWNNIYRTVRCKLCNKRSTYSISKIQNILSKHNYMILSKHYRNAKTKLKIRCNNNHIYISTWNKIQRGCLCTYCAKNASVTFSKIRNNFKDNGYKLITKKSEFINANKTLLTYICPLNHQGQIKWRNWYHGKNGCSICFKSTSRGENEVKEYISNLNITFIGNDRKTIFNEKTNRYLELDIFFPDINKAIEYNGSYWHKNNKNDILKQILCKKYKIQLMTITDSEWKNNTESCKNKILNFINN